jgi:hypothetical protein
MYPSRAGRAKGAPQGAFGEELLSSKNDDNEAQRITYTADQVTRRSFRKFALDERHSQKRKSHRQPGGEARPKDRAGSSAEFRLALLPEDLMNNDRLGDGMSGRLVLLRWV